MPRDETDSVLDCNFMGSPANFECNLQKVLYNWILCLSQFIRNENILAAILSLRFVEFNYNYEHILIAT